MEETLARLRGKSRKEYTILEEEEEEQLEEEEGEGQSKTPLSLSRALTSPDSVAMSECAIEGLLDQSEISEEVQYFLSLSQLYLCLSKRFHWLLSSCCRSAYQTFFRLVQSPVLAHLHSGSLHIACDRF